MTDHTIHDKSGDAGFFSSRAQNHLAMLAEDFRAVPPEAWIILAVATVLSNLFIALA
ncbi:hypothetical protein [Nitrospirillum iridis]|uniref:Uncharacterized protein n=1 Tax=Nitrospirillum iridis TaxID=765888 RepID=A0A7X0B1E1_9PROT|nr:hypothetical protein [Nitrospirillum iridis]MBB6252591.1 hypothetical protein [Nitrospirillum iridis]